MPDVKGWIAVVGFDKVVDPYPQAVAALGHPGTAGEHNYDAMVKTVKGREEGCRPRHRGHPLGCRAGHQAARRRHRPGPAVHRGGGGHPLRQPLPPPPAHGGLQGPSDLLQPWQFRLAELLHGRIDHGRGRDQGHPARGASRHREGRTRGNQIAADITAKTFAQPFA